MGQVPEIKLMMMMMMMMKHAFAFVAFMDNWRF